MIHGYPFTDYHELSLDFIMKLARESLGLHLETDGKFLKLVNANGDDISKLLVTYADMARIDDEGNTISAFIFNVGVDGNSVVFTKGNGEVTTITVPYSIKAEKDIDNKAITSYVHNVDVNGDNLIITFGDGSTGVVTVPFAIKARDDVNGKAITSYTANIVPIGDKLAVKDGNNNTIAEITVPYAVKASNDEDNDNIKATYGNSLATGTTTVKLLNKSGNLLNEITVPYSVSALEDTDGNAFLSDYGYHLGTNGRKTTIESHTGTTLNEITVPFATLSADAENAIESVTISGDNIVFTTNAGQNFIITAPYSVKALKDSLNNTFISSYISNVTNDNNTGKISFFSPDGTKLAEITPTVNKAVNDSFNNRIADYIKSIVTSPNSDYMTVTHGTGETDSITIHYATRAYQDTYDNVIGNTYIKGLGIITVDDDKYLVAYNGEDSELFRIAISDFIGSVNLNDLSNVNIDSTTLNNNDILIYNSTTNEWTNGANISLKRLEIQANINDTDLDYSADITSDKFINTKYYDASISSNISVSEFISEMSKGRMVYLRIGTISTGTTKVLYTPIVYTDLIGSTSVTRTINVINNVGGIAYVGHYEISFSGTPSINYIYEGTIGSPVVTPTPIDIGTLTTTGTPSFTFNMIPLSVLSNHTADTYYVNIDNLLHSRFSLFNYEIYNGSTFVVGYSNLAFAIQKLNENSSYKLNGKVVIDGGSGTLYTVNFHANYGDNFFTVDNVS